MTSVDDLINCLWAYEIDSFGNGDTAWEVYAADNEYVDTIQRDDFGNFLASARSFGYNVFINTYASWEAMDNA